MNKNVYICTEISLLMKVYQRAFIRYAHIYYLIILLTVKNANEDINIPLNAEINCRKIAGKC